jgi:GBP family porin
MLKYLPITLALTTFAHQAAAQQQVDLFGVVDLGIVYNSDFGAGSVTRLNSGNLSGSRLGFKGNEDLGGGLSAHFILENGFAADTGTLQQGGRLFGRQAFVGLRSKEFGTVNLGRQYPVFALPIGSDTAALRYGTNIMVHPLDLDFLAGTMRVNNAITYESPLYGGFQYRLQYALGELPGDQANNRAWSLGASYARQGLRANAGFTRLNQPAAANNQNGAVSLDYQAVLPLWIRRIDGASSGLPGSTSAAVAIGEQQTAAASAVYDIGKWSIGGVVSRTEFSGLAISGARTAGLNGANSQMRQRVAELNLAYRLAPNSLIGGMLSYTSATLAAPGYRSEPAWRHIGVAYNYILSKRTDIYSAIAYQKADGRNNVAVMGQTPATGDHQVSAIVGVRHRF